MHNENAIDFFTSYLKSTNRFYNPITNGCLSYENFLDGNFLIYNNLKEQNYTHGQLTLKLEFERMLNTKLFCVYIPIYEKKLSFDSYLNVQVLQ